MLEILQEILNFINQHFELIHFLSLLGCVLIFIGTIILITGIYKQKSKKLLEAIENQNNIQYLKIDLLNKKIYKFSIKESTNATTISLNEFLDIYEDSNKKQVNRWLVNQLNKKTFEEEYKEIINFDKKKKIYTRDILICTKNNPELNSLNIKYYSSPIGEKNKEPYFIKADYEIERCFFKLKKHSITNIGIVSFFYTDEKKMDNSLCLDVITRQQIIQKLLKKCDKNHLITPLKNGDIGLIILNQKDDSHNYLNSLVNEITCFFQLNNIYNVSFNICVYQNKGAKINYNECLKKIRSLKNYLLDNRKYTPSVTYYYDGGNYQINKKNSANERIKKAIERGEFFYRIHPFFNVRDGKVRFYKFEIEPSESSLLTMDQVRNAIFLSSLGKDYLKMLINKVDECFIENKLIRADKSTILFPTKLWFIDTILENITSIPDFFKYNFILSISNEEIESQQNDEYLINIRKLKELGIKVCLEMNAPIKPKEHLLTLIDYALFNEKIIKLALDDKQVYFLQNSLFSLFNNKRIRIIAEDIDNYQTLETLVSNNGLILSGKRFEVDNKPVTVLPKRVSSEIRNIYDKYY